MFKLLQLAAKVAMPTAEKDPRTFWLGCVGVREDGVMVSAKNGASQFSTVVENYQIMPGSHAEGRVLRKLGFNGEVYVARVSRKDNSLAIARPCGMCQVRLRSFRVRKVYYTINDCQYGMWVPHTNDDKIFNI